MRPPELSPRDFTVFCRASLLGGLTRRQMLKEFLARDVGDVRLYVDAALTDLGFNLLQDQVRDCIDDLPSHIRRRQGKLSERLRKLCEQGWLELVKVVVPDYEDDPYMRASEWGNRSRYTHAPALFKSIRWEPGEPPPQDAWEARRARYEHGDDTHEGFDGLEDQLDDVELKFFVPSNSKLREQVLSSIRERNDPKNQAIPFIEYSSVDEGDLEYSPYPLLAELYHSVYLRSLMTHKESGHALKPPIKRLDWKRIRWATTIPLPFCERVRSITHPNAFLLGDRSDQIHALSIIECVPKSARAGFPEAFHEECAARGIGYTLYTAVQYGGADSGLYRDVYDARP